MAEKPSGKRVKRGHSPSQIENIVSQPRRRHWQFKVDRGWYDYEKELSDFLNSETGEDGRPIKSVPVAMGMEISVDLRNYIEWSYDNDGRWVGRSIRMITE